MKNFAYLCGTIKQNKRDMEIEKRIKDFIKKYNLETLPLYYEGKYMGYLDKDLRYESGHLYRLTSRDAQLFAAERTLPIVEDVLNKWNEKMSTTIVKYVDNQRKSVDAWRGTFDEICADFETANNKLRYCNGDYFEFADEEMKMKYRVWLDLIPQSRAFKLYYGNGTVD